MTQADQTKHIVTLRSGKVPEISDQCPKKLGGAETGRTYILYGINERKTLLFTFRIDYSECQYKV